MIDRHRGLPRSRGPRPGHVVAAQTSGFPEQKAKSHPAMSREASSGLRSKGADGRVNRSCVTRLEGNEWHVDGHIEKAL